MALVLVVAAALGWGTYQRNEVYQSALAIWNDTVENCPLNYRAHGNRGSALNGMGQYDAAIKDYDKVIELNSGDAMAYNGRGIAYCGKGQYDAAIKDYDKALSLSPITRRPITTAAMPTTARASTMQPSRTLTRPSH